MLQTRNFAYSAGRSLRRIKAAIGGRSLEKPVTSYLAIAFEMQISAWNPLPFRI
jgi:hypothetical protein